MLPALVAASALVAPLNGVPSKRFEYLQNGINSSHWLAQSFQGYNQAHYDNYMSKGDFDLIKSIGFKHVRLTLNPIVLTGKDAPSSTLTAEGLKVLDTAIDNFLKRKIAVIVDIHPEDGYKDEIAKDSALATTFVEFWSKLASHLKSRNPDMVFLEVMNEPNFLQGDVWRSLQGRVVQAIRKAAPQHTIIVNPGKWSGLGDLLEMKPYQTKNLIYTFHNYEPFIFTHQGAEWGWDKSRLMKQVPYPSSPEAVAKMIGTVQDEVALGALKDYGNKRWNTQVMYDFIKRASDWSKQNNVPIYCGEFGTYKAFVDPNARLRWISDSVAAYNKLNIGWAMWDYAGGFSVAVGEEGKRTADTATVQALGLKK